MTNLPEVFLESSLFYTIVLFQKICHHSIYCKLKNELLLKMNKVSYFVFAKSALPFKVFILNAYFLPCVSFWELRWMRGVLIGYYMVSSNSGHS